MAICRARVEMLFALAAVCALAAPESIGSAEESRLTGVAAWFDGGDDVIKGPRVEMGTPLPQFTWEEPGAESPLEEPLDQLGEFPAIQWRVRHRGASQPG